MAKIPAISFSSLTAPQSGTLVLLAGAKGKLGKTGAGVDKSLDGAIGKALKAADFQGAYGKAVELWGAGKLSRVIVMGTHKAAKGKGAGQGLDAIDWLNLGGKAMARLAGAKGQVTVALEAPGAGREDVAADDAAEFALGLKLRAYRFDKYFTKGRKDRDGKAAGNGKDAAGIAKVTVGVAGNTRAARAFTARDRIAGGVLLARDLVNEPANELGPVEFAAKAKELTGLGVKVEVLTEREMKKLKMNALLGVSQGSVRPPRLVVMRWNGAKNARETPVAFIGKGVVFDTGGISIKPAGGMEDMKGDMAGAACVTGLMHALAARKARVNAIGVIGLVENMPDGNAQRPGDIVTSMSGQTIEIINTDAEGRLVLADALWYTQDRFKPKFMINLATLTGAVIVALGKHYAGLFSNDDELSGRLTKAGEATAERVWRLPLGEEYDKAIDSRFADMKNTGGRDAGAIAAAQFLQRYVNGVPWAHLDIAGTAMAAPSSDISTGWAPGFGVRLLDRLVADSYEK